MSSLQVPLMHTKKCIEQNKETRMFKGCIKEGKVYLLGGKKTTDT